MDISKTIKKILIEEEISLGSFAEKLGTSQQNISAKLKRNNFSVREMLEIAEVLNYDLTIQFDKKILISK